MYLYLYVEIFKTYIIVLIVFSGWPIKQVHMKHSTEKVNIVKY
jgi:hypothetical protein